MTVSFARRWSVLPSDGRRRGRAWTALRRSAAVVELLAIALWLGGMLALGAIAAPVVFARVALPSSADAMTVVFQRFDVLAIASAAAVLVAEGAIFVSSAISSMTSSAVGSAVSSARFTARDLWRVGAAALAGGIAVVEATAVAPRIAALHAAGVLRGIGSGGMELGRLHDIAEGCGKAEVVLLVAVVVLQVVALSEGPRHLS